MFQATKMTKVACRRIFQEKKIKTYAAGYEIRLFIGKRPAHNLDTAPPF